MAAPAKQRFFHIYNFKLGAADYNTIKEVSWTEDTEEIADSGDDDAFDTFVEKGKSVCRGEITLSDPIQALAMKASAAANVTFNSRGATGVQPALVTIKNVQFFNLSPRFMHNGVAMTRLTFRAFITDGTAIATVAPVSGGG